MNKLFLLPTQFIFLRIEEFMLQQTIRSWIDQLLVYIGISADSARGIDQWVILAIIVAIDQKGVPVAPFIISETYTVEENTAALAEVSIDSYAWYDGAELAQLDPINFAGFEEYAVLLLKVSHNDKAAHWWTGCFMGDLSNPDEYSDRSIINNLVTYGIPEFKDAVDQLLAVYWDENTICGVAADAEGNYGPVIRQVVNLTKEGASPAGELIGGGLSNINLMDMRQAKFAHR